MASEANLIGILLAGTAALGWGASDFFGGEVSRRHTPVFIVVAVSELLGLVLLLPVLAIRGVPPPADPRLLGAGLAGVSVTAELSLIYLALSRGQAFITAPVGALGATIAVGIGLVGGDPVDLAIAAGLMCALVGSGISAWTSPAGAGRRGALRSLATCVAAATAVGITLTGFHAAGRLDPYWATATMHASTTMSAGLAAFIVQRRSPHNRPLLRHQLPALALIATVGVGGDLAYAAASQRGALSIVSAISSLYPLTTIALGALLQGLRPTRIQLVGITLALLGAALLGASAR